MTTEESRSFRQLRIDEILGLQREPAKEAWLKAEMGLDDISAAAELGFSSNYFQNLVAQEFVYKLSEGTRLEELPTLSKSLETACWKAVFNQVKLDGSAAIDTPLCKQLRLKLRRLFEAGFSIREINQGYDIDESQIISLLMLGLAESGLSLRRIGNEFGVTAEAARRRIALLGVSVNALRRDLSREAENKASRLRERLEAWITAHPGCYISEISNFFNISDIEIKQARPKNLKRLVIGSRPKKSLTNQSLYTREEILDALRLAYQIVNPAMTMYSVSDTRPLTSTTYENLCKGKRVRGPSRGRIIQKFGSWSSACEEAGVPSVKPLRDSYERIWTEEQLIEKVAEFISSGEFLGADSYDKWARLDSSRPSSGTLRNQLGKWSDCHKYALAHLRKKWTSG